MRIRRTSTRRNTETTTSQKSSIMAKVGYALLLAFLLFGNIYMFASSVKISDSITHLETQTEKVRKENAELHQKIFAENSLYTLEYIAQQKGFTKEAEPYFLGKADFAMAR